MIALAIDVNQNIEVVVVERETWGIAMRDFEDKIQFRKNF